MSSPPRSAQSTPTRTPLQERTQSQTNEVAARLGRKSKDDVAASNFYGASPFPTKPQHVLLPSTIRKQKSQKNLGTDIFRSEHGFGSSGEGQSAPPFRQPAVRLKKSVKTLRDMYEAQSDDSRPSTALSASRSRPGSSSSKVRSFSSSEGLSGRYAWEQFKNAVSDDMALLPSLPEDSSTMRPVHSTSPFADRSVLPDNTSSPNFRVIGGTSSPRATRQLEFSSGVPEESVDSSSMVQNSSSSPNVMRFGRSSSVEELPSVDERSSPNFIKLGTSSPNRSIIAKPFESSTEDLGSIDPISSPNFVKLGTSSPVRTLRDYEPSSSIRRVPSTSSDVSRERNRGDDDQHPSFAERAGASNPFPSSSPPETFDPTASKESFRSSPPMPPLVRTKSELVTSPDASSIVEPFSYPGYDTSSVTGTHEDLQAALSSSPVPPIQYPVVRAPAPAQSTGLNVYKRQNRSSTIAESLTPRWPSRLSAGTSDANVNSRDNSKRSSLWEDTDEVSDSDDVVPGPYAMDEETNASQIRIIPVSERHEEADDEVMGLPGDGYRQRVNQLMRSASYTHSPSSSVSRINSMQSSVEARLNSLNSRRPSLKRPGSSSSLASAVVPTWARRYYSGLYQDSFKYLLASTSKVNVTQTSQPQNQHPAPPRPESILTTATTDTPRGSRRSFTSLRESLSEKLPALLRPRNRPRLEARKSHTMPGIGPLVSHPVRGPATAAILSSRPSHPSMRTTFRPVSFPVHPADPRAHWAGFAEKSNSPGIGSSAGHHASPSMPFPQGGMPYMIPPRRMSRLPSISPHLHHDHRLNTGSTASRGYGHPYNRQSRYSNHSDMRFDDSPELEGRSRRNWQVISFSLGFICPILWFVGAILPLPRRPDAFADIEKGHWQRASIHGGVTEREAMSVLNQLRREKRLRGGEELNWQNARWWRNINRWMCIIGAIVLILVVVLAVIGTTRGL